MTDPIRTTRLEVPVDENGIPLFAAIEAGEIKKYIRSTRLEVPVTEDINGNKIPVVAVAGGLNNANFELFTLVEELPEEGDPQKIYLVPHENELGENDQFYECIYINGQWESLGTITISNFENYFTKTEIETLLSGKVDNVSGKGLSANNFTDDDKAKLDDCVTSSDLDGVLEETLEDYYTKTEVDELMDVIRISTSYNNAMTISTANPTKFVAYPEP
jgi:hypothetical protein